MEFLTDLWVPIVLSSAIVFVVSYVIWMFLQYHKGDIKKLPNEANVLQQLRALGIPPGFYMFPMCDTGAEMKSEEYKRRYAAGPWGSIRMIGSQPNFLRNLVLIFLFYIVVGVFVGYVTSLALPYGAAYLAVFRVSGTVAIAAYVLGGIPNAIFHSKPLRYVMTDTLDGIIYGLLTAGVFGWLWPEAPLPV